MTQLTWSSRPGKLINGYGNQDSGYLPPAPGRVHIDHQGVKGIFCSLSWSGRWWLRCVMSECIELTTSFWVFILYKLHLNIKCKNCSLQIFCTLCVYYHLDSAPSKIPPSLNFIWFHGPCSKLGFCFQPENPLTCDDSSHSPTGKMNTDLMPQNLLDTQAGKALRKAGVSLQR